MMCASFVYKRRKLRNSVALLSKENHVESSKPHDGCKSSSSYGDVNNLLIMKNDLERAERIMNSSVSITDHGKNPSNGRNSPATLPPDARFDGNVVLVLASVPESTYHSPKQRVHRQWSHVDNFASNHNSIENESCSSSKSNLEQLPASKNSEEDVCECSSSGVKGVEQQDECHPSKKFCISVLKSSGLIGGSWPINTDISLNVLGGNGAGSFQQCKICGLMGIPQKMLICDLCEESFHMPCCQVKVSPRDEWYCQPCYNKKPKPLLDVAAGKLFPTASEEYKRRILQQELGPIQFMLIDTQPYTSGVRIGKDFQVDVPELSDQIPDYHDQSNEPMELNVEYENTKEWNSTKSSKTGSIGNWLQCREIVYDSHSNNYEGICGKWRRAPLFATQTDDWDCSCSVVWDPFHADCAIPQELETNEVLKHLKYVDMIRNKLNRKKKST